jgi:truncated hemoglobin YjbI
MSNKDAYLITVESFYAKATQDVLIGYHFRHLHDFPAHFEKISAFWKMHLTQTPYPKNLEPIRLMAKHFPLNLKMGELHRWILLFKATLDENPGQLSLDVISKWKEKIDLFRDFFIERLFSN